MTLYASHPLWNYNQFSYTPPNKSFSGNTHIDALINGYRWSEKNSTGQTVISYSFMNSASQFVGNYSSFKEPSGRTYFSEEVRALTRTVLDQIEEVCQLSFVEVKDNDQECGVIRYGYSQVIADHDAGAWAYSPGSSPRSGDVWINPEYADKQVSSWGYTLANMILHESLHAIGLKHPFESDGAYLSTLSDTEDIQANTVMSYTPALNSTRQWLSYWPQEPMAYDIDALQFLYGPSSYQSGNTIYYLADSSFNGQLRTLWDSAGTDTLDASLVNQAVSINLNAGTASNIGQSVSSSAAPYNNTLTLAAKVVIENVIGSSYGDTIHTNEANNLIQSLAGNDVIYASSGHDVIDGGAGDDQLVADLSVQQFQFRLLDNVLSMLASNGSRYSVTQVERFQLAGTDYSFTELSHLVNGVFNISASKASFQSAANNKVNPLNTLTYQVSNSATPYLLSLTLDATQSYVSQIDFMNTDGAIWGSYTPNAPYSTRSTIENALKSGKLKTLWTYLFSGDDMLTLSHHNDYLQSGAGDDWIFGLAGNDLLEGGMGNDILDGGPGDDQLNGAAGDDVYRIDSLKDKVIDSAGQDSIETTLNSLSLTNFKTIEDVTFTGSGNATLTGNNLANHLVGGSSDDTLDGGLGPDLLTGGLGQDHFLLTTALKNNCDTITDFVSGIDKIALSGKIFTKLKDAPNLSDNFALDQATKMIHYLIFNTNNGTLYYDADGNASKSAPIAVAVIGSSLLATDIEII